MTIREEHIKSILFGVAVGDALGVPVEFVSREILRKDPVVDMRKFGTHNQPRGTWSDDSSMMFCLAESLLEVPFDLQNLANRFINWVDYGYWTPYDKMFDIGNTTSAAIERLRTLTDPTLAGGLLETENGNGALMRILPLVIMTYKMPIDDAFTLIKSVASLTHRHIRSTLSCFYYLSFARLMIRGYSLDSAYNETNRLVKNIMKENGFWTKEHIHFNRILNGDLYSISYDDLRGTGYVIHSLESSLWCLFHSNNYKDVVLQAVNLGDDTDTTAAIAGGLAALYFGFDSIPTNWLNAIAKKDEIKNLADRLTDRFVIKLTLEDIPEPDDVLGAGRLSAQFTGYTHSVQETGRRAKITRRKIQENRLEDVTPYDVLESIFFHFRARRHGGQSPDKDFINDHLEILRKLVKTNKK